MKDIANLLTKIRSQKILIVGDFLLDEYIYGQTTRISREAPVIILQYDKTVQQLGGAGNAVLNAAAWGGTIIPLGLVGDDDTGRTVLSHLQRMDITTEHILISKGRHTPLKTRVLAGAENVKPQQMFRLDRESQGPYPQSVQKELASHFYEILDLVQPDFILVSDYGLQTLTGTLRYEIGNTGILKKFPVIVDARFDLDKYSDMLAITPNMDEAIKIYGSKPNSTWELKEMGRMLLGFSNAKYVLLTRGNQGMVLFSAHHMNDNPCIIEADARFSPIDTTGVGDTATVAFSRALIAGASPTDAIQLANIAAGISITKQGASVANLDDVATFAIARDTK